jgi:hypothetical protein
MCVQKIVHSLYVGTAFVQVYWVMKLSVSLSCKTLFNMTNVPGFSASYNLTYLTMHTNIFTFPQYAENTYSSRITITQPLTEHRTVKVRGRSVIFRWAISIVLDTITNDR